MRQIKLLFQKKDATNKVSCRPHQTIQRSTLFGVKLKIWKWLF